MAQQFALLDLTYGETCILGMAIANTIEYFEDMANNQKLNWTPEARQDIKEMLAAAFSLKAKMEKIGIDVSLADIEPGDENEFLTKES